MDRSAAYYCDIILIVPHYIFVLLVLYDVDPEDLKAEIRGVEERAIRDNKTRSSTRTISSVVHRPVERGRGGYVLSTCKGEPMAQGRKNGKREK